MGAPDDTSAPEANTAPGQPKPFLNASYNPRDIHTAPLSPQDAAARWNDTPPAGDWRQELKNKPAGSTPAASPPVTSAPVASTPSSPASADGASPYAAAAQHVKAQNEQARAQAALLLHAQGGNTAPVPDEVLARYFYTTPEVAAANRATFQPIYNLNQSRMALAGSSILPRVILRNPTLAPLLRNQVAPLATAERVLSRETSAGDVAYEAVKGFAGYSNGLMKAGSLALAAPLIAVDRLASLLTGKEDTSLEDAWFDHTTRKLDENQAYFEYDPATGFSGKLAHGLGGVGGMVPYMFLTGGAGGATGLTARVAQGTRAMAVPAATEGVNTASDVYGATGSGAAAAKAGAMTAGTTTLQGVVPLSLPGKALTRVLTAPPIGVLTGEVSRRLNNAALPDNMQQPFDAEGAGVNAILSSAMAALPKLHQQAMTATANFERLKTLSKAAQEVKIRTENPEVFRQLVRPMAAGSDLKDLHVTGEVLDHLMDKHGVTMGQLGASLPDLARQLPDAVRQKGDVVIPIWDYLIHMAGTQMGEDLLPQVRAPKGIPYADARQIQVEQADRAKEEAVSQVKDDTKAAEFRQSQGAVEYRILTDLNTINRFSAEDNALIAKVQTAILSRIAAAQKITPELACDKYGANLRGEIPDGAGDVFRQQNEDIARDPNFLREAIRILSEGDADVFKMPIIRRNSLADTLRDHFDHKGTETQATGDMGVFPVALHPDGTEVHAFRTPDGENFWVTARPDGTVHINVSQLRGHGNGQYIYQAVHDYAAHNNKVFNADPAGLTDESLIRRTTNMLNAIIRHNTAAHILPGVEQFAGDEKLGVPPLKWGRTEVDKFNALAQTFVRTVENNVPDIKDIHYDSAKKGFYNSRGVEVPRSKWAALAESREAQGIRAGESSLRRAVFLKSLIHSEGKGQRERERVLGELRLFVGGSAKRAGLDRLFQAAHEPTDMPAINGGAEAEPRGSYDPQTRTIALLKSANASTPYHETGHWALDIYTKIAADPAVSPELRADTDAILKWMGVKDLPAWDTMSLEEQRPYHEQFARGFETYLMEGKAPTRELQPVFERIKNLLREIYTSLRERSVKLGPDIRRVMDRMLGGEGESRAQGDEKSPD